MRIQELRSGSLHQQLTLPERNLPFKAAQLPRCCSWGCCNLLANHLMVRQPTQCLSSSKEAQIEVFCLWEAGRKRLPICSSIHPWRIQILAQSRQSQEDLPSGTYFLTFHIEIPEQSCVYTCFAVGLPERNSVCRDVPCALTLQQWPGSFSYLGTDLLSRVGGWDRFKHTGETLFFPLSVLLCCHSFLALKGVINIRTCN